MLCYRLNSPTLSLLLGVSDYINVRPGNVFCKQLRIGIKCSLVDGVSKVGQQPKEVLKPERLGVLVYSVKEV